MKGYWRRMQMEDGAILTLMKGLYTTSMTIKKKYLSMLNGIIHGMNPMCNWMD